MKKAMLRFMSIGLFATTGFAILMSAVILAGLGAGYLVNYLLPAIDVGSAAIFGVLAFGVAIHCVVQFLRTVVSIFLHSQQEDDTDEDEDEDFDRELLSDEQLEAMANQVSEAVALKLGSLGNRRSASSKHRR